jgi:hypothetical protein
MVSRCENFGTELASGFAMLGTEGDNSIALARFGAE